MRQLTEVGFLAAACAQHSAWAGAAQRIFEALVRLRPQRSFGYIGQALSHLNAGQAEQAAQRLEQAAALVLPGERAQLHAFEALALQLAGRTQQRQQSLQQAGQHPLALALALARTHASSPIPSPASTSLAAAAAPSAQAPTPPTLSITPPTAAPASAQ